MITRTTEARAGCLNQRRRCQPATTKRAKGISNGKRTRFRGRTPWDPIATRRRQVRPGLLRLAGPADSRQSWIWSRATTLVDALPIECKTLEDDKWYLSGGTALLAEWRHRHSTDIDIRASARAGAACKREADHDKDRTVAQYGESCVPRRYCVHRGQQHRAEESSAGNRGEGEVLDLPTPTAEPTAGTRAQKVISQYGPLSSPST